MKKTVTTFELKLIALVSMTIDHVGFIFFPQHVVFRLIGRISFPLFAYLLIQSFFLTKNRRKFLIRLLLFAILSEPLYDYAFFSKWYYPLEQNIFFTLSLGFLCIWGLEKINFFLKQRFQSIDLYLWQICLCAIWIVLISCCSLIFHVSYEVLSILYFCLFYFFKQSYWLMALSFIMITILGSASYLQYAGILFLPFIYFHNRQKGKSWKYFFYLYYPLHLFILILFKNL